MAHTSFEDGATTSAADPFANPILSAHDPFADPPIHSQLAGLNLGAAPGESNTDGNVPPAARPYSVPYSQPTAQVLVPLTAYAYAIDFPSY
jgi:hypothetical protein